MNDAPPVRPVRFCARMLLGFLCALASAALAAEPPPVPSHAAMVSELRGLARRLAEAREQFTDASSAPGSVASALATAQVAILEEEFGRAVLVLSTVLARPGIERDAGHGDVLATLGDALWRAGLRRAGRARLQEALAHLRLPSAYRRTLATYLERAALDVPLAEIREHWRRHQQLRPEGPLDSIDRDVRYGYAKALYHGGAIAEAETLFDAIEAGDPHHVRARYFLGVVALGRGHRVKARKAFEEALAAWRQAAPEAPPREDDEEPEHLDVDAEPVSQATVVVSEIPPDTWELPDEAERRRQRTGEAVHLALARLAAAEGQPSAAWAFYRAIPPGSPDFPAALTEATVVLAQRGDYAWCARLVDQLLAGRGDDGSSAQLALWRAQLLAQAAEYEDAQAQFVALEEALRRRADDLVAAPLGDERLFAEAVLAWNEPEIARRARDVESEMVDQAEDLLVLNDDIDALAATLADPAPLPAIQRGRLVRAEIAQQLDAFLGRLMRADAAARDEADVELYGDGPAADRAEVVELRTSAERLAARLERFDAALTDQDRRLRQRATAILAEERPLNARYRAELDTEEGRARLLATAMRSTARQNVESWAAAAFFGQVDLAWWRKEELTRRIEEAAESNRRTLEALDAVRTDALEGEPRPKAPPPPTR